MPISSPYNFIPLSDTVHTLDWQEASQDVPLADGVSGTLSINLQTFGNLMVGDTHTKSSSNKAGKVDFFTTPDGNIAIPGTSIKGAIRNILDIATFAKFSQIEDRRFGVRDLNYKDYTKKFSTNESGYFRSNVQAGWLSFQKNTWQLEPVAYHRIEQNSIGKKIANDFFGDKIERCSADQKYKEYMRGNKGKLSTTFSAQTDYEKQQGTKMIYSQASFDNPNKQDDLKGYLIFTGQTMDRFGFDRKTGKRIRRRTYKHMEFIFEESVKQNPVIANDNLNKVMKDFLFIYNSDNKELKYLNTLIKNGKLPAIPVFYLEKDGEIHSMGLSQLYKLASDYSTYDCVKNTATEHLDQNQKVDFTTLMFGSINDEVASKSRVNFGLFTPEKTIAAESLKYSEETILSSPKPTYYPNYIKQPNDGSNILPRGEKYNTYLSKDAELRGWKRYPVKKAIKLGDVPQNVNGKKTIIKMQHLTEDTVFQGKMRFHNLSKIELGALLWVLLLTDNTNIKINIGMAKSFGYGKVNFKIDHNQSSPISHNKEQITFSECVEQFKAHMKEHINDWEKSDQIKTLLAILNENEALEHQKETKTTLQHMKLREYRDAKQQKQILPDFIKKQQASNINNKKQKNEQPVNNAMKSQFENIFKKS